MTDNPDYQLLESQLSALLTSDRDALATSANFVALLFEQIPRINWLGFYLMKDGELVLGPFQGKPATTRIAVGDGVCGAAVTENATQRVADVHAFPGHIACDPDSKSELVIPLGIDGKTIGVLDIDSPYPDRFDERDQMAIERLCDVFLNRLGPDGMERLTAT